MKAAGTNTLAALQSGQFILAELYDLTLSSGTVLRFTDYDLPLTISGNVYASNLVVERGTLTTKIGVESQTLDLTLSPQRDAATAFTVNGYPLLKAVSLGMLDAAHVTMYKCFMQDPSGTVLPTVTHNESVVWFKGQVSDALAGRQSAKITVESDLGLLQVQMPRNVMQTACTRTFCDAGCGLSLATYTTAGSVSATGPNSATSFTTNLTKADGYFALGYIKFTSGANSGVQLSVKASLLSNGTVTLSAPLPFTPSSGDTFSITAGCDRQLATCKTKWAADNSIHFRGFPWVPVPETLYDGGTISAPVPTIAYQGQPGVGSPTGGRFAGRYKP